MDKVTIDQILKLNKDFYELNAQAFSSTREGAWRGWDRLTPYIRKFLVNREATNTFSVLDLGCGNGRFYKFLNTNNLKFTYLGVDISTALFKAAAMLNPGAKFVNSDFLQVDSLVKIHRKFDLVVGFGVTHHIPDKNLRAEWFKNLYKLVTDNGMVVMTFWQDEFSEDKVENTSLKLDENDYLLKWANNPNALRYVHRYSAEEHAEIEDLVHQSGLSVADRYLADGQSGKSNLYLVWKKRT
jgi:SAM-dependent methyltransferase